MTKWKGEVASYAPNVAQAITRISSRSLHLSLAAGLALGCATADAADRYWDANGTGVGSGGTGNWSLTAPTWSPSDDGVSGPYSAWSNIALDNAIFGGTAGTVTLGSPITVHDLTFNTNGYTLTGGTLNLAGATPTITTTSGTSTINSVIAGSSGLTKAGGRTLTLNGANTFNGDVNVLAGELGVNANAALGAVGNIVNLSDGARLTATGSLSGRTVNLAGAKGQLTGSGVGDAFFTGSGGVEIFNGVSMTNDANDFTGQATFFVNGDAYFTSVGNIGEASSLGAGNTANDPIVFTGSNQFSDWLHYTGDGDSSNRNWRFQSSGGTSGNRLLNDGTGTLTLTGGIDVNMSAGRFMQFWAQTADLELLGTISNVNGTPISFDGGPGRSITLGGANTYAGATVIGGSAVVTVNASVLADTGTNSSFGTGTAGGISIANGSVLSYTGTGSSSNRNWTIGVADPVTGMGGSILNDGSGALALSGTTTFQAGVASGLMLGGNFTGVNTLSGVISGDGALGSSGSGTWVLGAANTRTGDLIIEGGTLRAGNASAFGTTTGVTVNGGTLDLNGYDLTTPTLAGTGGAIALGTATLTVNTTDSTSYAGSITGTGGLAKSGKGSLTLSGANSYTGDTSLSGGGITIDFSAAGAPASSIIAADSTLNMAGGALTLVGADGIANSQTFDGLNIFAGSNRIVAISGAGGSMADDLGAITRTGGLVDFVLPTNGDFTTSSASLGGWATVNGSDYAKVVGGVITAFTAADYTNEDNAANWQGGKFISDAGGTADTPFFGTVSGSPQLGGLKYTAAANSTVNIAAGQTLGIDGTIIVASSVGLANQTITGGSLTGGAGGGTLGVLQNGGARFTIGSTIVDNGGATGFTKGGEGIVRLASANTYTGVTTLSGGELQIASLADAGLASSIGKASADSSNLVLESGMLHYVGGTDDSTNRGFTLVNGGASAPVVAVDGGRTVEFSGLVTSPDDAGLTKTGWGTLVLSNDANDYVGVTTIRGGGGSGFSTISVNTLADGGVASGIGAASSDPANLLIDGTLSYTGGSVTIDRGFTTTGGQIAVDDAAATLEFTGATAGAGFIKDGAGTLVLSGVSARTGTTQLDNGTLRAGTINAFGSGRIHFANTAGATVDLAGYATTVAYLTGGGTTGGNITLGTATLTLNWGGGSATYAGAISGGGGLILNGGITQKLTGCDSSYTGVTVINDGVLAVSCLTDGGANSSIDVSTADASNLVINGGTLRYIGTGGSTDRQFTLGASGGNALDASGTGAVEFTSNAPLTFSGTDTAQTLTLTGTNKDNNTLAAKLTDNGTGVTSLSKTGIGTWVLTNPGSIYIGATTILGGVLGVDWPTAARPAASALLPPMPPVSSSATVRRCATPARATPPTDCSRWHPVSPTSSARARARSSSPTPDR